MTYRVSPTTIADMISFVVVDCALDQNLTAEEAFGGCLRRLGLMHFPDIMKRINTDCTWNNPVRLSPVVWLPVEP